MALHLTSGGIAFTDFSSEGGATSETLDDYEEGVWSPGTSVGTGTVGGTGNVNKIYTKIGRMSHCFVSMTFASSGGTVQTLTGIPFTSSSDSYGVGCIGYTNYISATAICVQWNAATIAYFYKDNIPASLDASALSGKRMDVNVMTVSA